MKVTPLTESAWALHRVRDKKDREGSPKDQHQDQSSQRDQDGSSFEAVSENAIHAAVEQFQDDEQARASGLVAEAEGQGPGLRVTLKDSSGGIVRQFTGEEFIRLREACKEDGRGRGKILDQKL